MSMRKLEAVYKQNTWREKIQFKEWGKQIRIKIHPPCLQKIKQNCSFCVYKNKEKLTNPVHVNFLEPIFLLYLSAFLSLSPSFQQPQLKGG